MMWLDEAFLNFARQEAWRFPDKKLYLVKFVSTLSVDIVEMTVYADNEQQVQSEINKNEMIQEVISVEQVTVDNTCTDIYDNLRCSLNRDHRYLHKAYSLKHGGLVTWLETRTS